MIKTILVAASGHEADATLRAALPAAQLFAAHLDFFHLRYDVASLVGAAGMYPSFMPPSILADWEAQGEAAAIRTRQDFENFCKREQIRVSEAPQSDRVVSAAWRDGNEEELVSAARCHDLAVLTAAGEEFGPMPSLAELVLIGSGRPVLAVPARWAGTLDGTVVVAWKDSAEAARAITAAMPFLHKARKIIVVTVAEPGVRERSFAELVANLKWHGLPAISRRIESQSEPTPDVLFDVAIEEGAALMVMGGYGHSRARELVLGGFTRYALRQAGLPVFLAH